MERKTQTPERVATLTPNDRCDRCEVAQARVKLTLPSGLTVYLCKHHYERAEASIVGRPEYTVLDERWTLDGGK